MTLKHRDEFGRDYRWEKIDTLNGCKLILLTAVNRLLFIEPFNHSSLERNALILFRDNFITQLEELIPGASPLFARRCLSHE
ncbi:MAG: hypothetical protein ACOYKA_07335, partial [Legionellaceae bacterium]